jgi:hypothetical protein
VALNRFAPVRGCVAVDRSGTAGTSRSDGVPRITSLAGILDIVARI